jgi:hypothetical protein
MDSNTGPLMEGVGLLFLLRVTDFIAIVTAAD